MRRTIAVAAIGALVVTAGVTSPAGAAVGVDSSALRSAVTVAGITEHLEALSDAADASILDPEFGYPTRVDGSAGFEESVEYARDVFEAAGYDVTLQQFTFDAYELAAASLDQVSPTPTSYGSPDDFVVMEYSASGVVSAPIQAVDLVLPPAAAANTSTSGCEAADFAGFTAGNIALLQRGTCSFRIKTDNAAAAGASAVLIFNEGQPERTDAINGTLDPPISAVPTVGVTFAVGAALAAALDGGPVTMRVAVDASVVTTPSTNVIAETSGGRSDRTVVVGAHLDSVTEGPGINDNGSGSAAILELAEEMAELGITPRNKVRFALWGGEEFGLLGAEHYVSSLSSRELKDIAVNLNFDMIGSPNYVRFVYDGDGSASGTAGPNGSGVVERVFTDYFAAAGLPVEPTEFDGRSDYGPFIERGIPAGGLFTGAEGIKTAEEAETYGGEAGVAYDACYHQACDDLDNVNPTALDEMSDAVAHAVLQFAMTTSSVNGTAKSSKTTSVMDHRGARLLR